MNKLIAICFAIVVFCLIIGIVANAGAEEYSNTEIVDAIWVIEGGTRAQYAYGIRSVKYKDLAEARRICLRTVVNNRKRYADYGYKQYADYLSFLASRYCPVGCGNDRGTNKFWLRNLRYQLAKARSKCTAPKTKS